MWSRGARASTSEYATPWTSSERAPLVLARAARGGSTASAREDDDARASHGVGVDASIARERDADASEARDGGVSARTKLAHLIPGVVALVGCALVLWIGSAFVEHPVWRFEHVSRWAARRDAAVGSGEAMRCRKDASVTGGESCMPAFAVVGSHVGGARRLRALMSQHDMLTDLQKTVHFFNPVYGATQGVQMCEPKGLLLKAYFASVLAGKDAWSPYDPAQTMKRKKDGEAFDRALGDVVSGDWSDTYFNCACCAATMKRLMPELRPIVVLRDPVGRAMARYVEENHPHGTPVEAAGLSACALKENGYTWGKTAKKTQQNLEQCLEETKGESSETVARECLDFHSFLGWSLYAEYLEIWKKEFPNLLVLYADDIEDNPEQVARAVESYLGLPPNIKPYDFTALGARTSRFSSVPYDLQPQLSKTEEDKKATEELVKFFEPHVAKLQKMAKEGKIPALPYMWQRRYNVQEDPTRFSSARKLLAGDTIIVDSLENEDSERSNMHKSSKHKSSKHVDEENAPDMRSMDIEDVLGAIGDSIAKAESDGGKVDNSASVESEQEPTAQVGKSEPRTKDDDIVFLDSLDGEYGDSSVDAAAAVGADKNLTISANATDDIMGEVATKAKNKQKQAEEKAQHMKPTWKANTVRGRFYSDLYIPMDESVRDDLKGNVFVPVAVPYLFQFANEFKHKNAWMDIIGIKKEEQARVYSELWRDDCTHSQQWSGENGCCGESCCFVAGHRQEITGFRG